LSLCSLIYSASAVPAAAHAPAKIGQVIENKLKIAATATSSRAEGGPCAGGCRATVGRNSVGPL